METRSSSHAIEKSAEGIGRILTAPAKGMIELFSLGKPVDTIVNETRQGFGDILKMPFRVAGHIALGTAKTAGKLAVAGMANAPLFPVRAENSAVRA